MVEENHLFGCQSQEPRSLPGYHFFPGLKIQILCERHAYIPTATSWPHSHQVEDKVGFLSWLTTSIKIMVLAQVDVDTATVYVPLIKRWVYHGQYNETKVPQPCEVWRTCIQSFPERIALRQPPYNDSMCHYHMSRGSCPCSFSLCITGHSIAQNLSIPIAFYSQAPGLLLIANH